MTALYLSRTMLSAHHPGPGENDLSSELGQTLFTQSRDIILVVRLRDGRILKSNPAAERAYGYSRTELLSLSIRDLRAPETHGLIGSQMQQAHASGILFESLHRRKDGTHFPVEVSSMGTAFGKEPANLSIVRDISERKSADRLLQRVFASLTETVLVLDPAPRIIQMCSPAVEQMLGYRPEELIGGTTQCIFESAEDFEAFGPRASAGLDREGIYHTEQWLRRKDGGRICAQITVTEIRDETGQQIGIVGSLVDITERKLAEQDLAESEERYRKLVELSPDCIAVHSQGKIAFINPAGIRLLGVRSADDLLGKSVIDFTPIEDRQRIVERFMQMAQGLPVPPLEEKIIRPDGSIAEGEIRATPILYQGKPAVLLVGRDISEQKQARRAIRESERHLRALVKAAPLGLHQYELLSDGRLILSGANPAADKILGIDHQGLIGIPIEEAFPMHRETDIPALYRRTALDGIPYSCQQISYQDNQIQGVFEIQVFQTGPSRVAVFFQEITEKKRAEEALRESEERYRLLFSSGNDAVFVYPLLEDGRPGHFTDVNEIACQRLGYTREELLEKSFIDINFAEISGRSTGLMKTLKQSGQLLATSQHRTKSGKAIPVEVNSRIFVIGDKTMVISVARDITERKQAQDRVARQVARLSALQAIDKSILSAKDLNQTLDILLEQITHTLQVDGANLLLYDSTRKTLTTSAERNLPPGSMWLAGAPLMETLAGKAAQARSIEFIPDLSQYQDPHNQRAHKIGKYFCSYLAVPLEAKGELKGILQLFHRELLDPDPDWFGFLRALADQAAIAIDSAQLFQALKHTNRDLVDAYDKTIEGWARALDLRDKETEGHSQRVTDLTLDLARRMGVEEDQLVHIRRGARLHDIGKMGVPDEILLKPGPLNEAEWQIMRQHPTSALDLLYPIDFLGLALEIPYSHHEKWDGTGYPQGLKEQEIPLSARIFAVIDVWDALTHDRPYRKAWAPPDVLAYIREQSGKHFDPQVVTEFLALVGRSPNVLL